MEKKILFTNVVLSLVILLSPIIGCAKVKTKAEAMKPEVREIILRWGEITSATSEVIATIKVYNPNPISLPVKKVSCGITINGIRMGSAEAIDLKIEKSAEFPIKISAKIDNTKIPTLWVEHLKRNERSEALIDINTTFDLLVTDFTFPYSLKRPIETDLLSALKKLEPVSVEKKAKLPLIGEKTVFKITLESLSGKWGTITPETTQVNLLATIRNENPYPLVVPKVQYKVDMNRIALTSGESGTNYLFAPNSKNDVSTTVMLEMRLMDKWFVSHIRQGEKSTFNIKVSLVLELPKEIAQQLGQDRLIVAVWEGSQEFETDILGSKK